MSSLELLLERLDLLLLGLARLVEALDGALQVAEVLRADRSLQLLILARHCSDGRRLKLLGGGVHL